MKYLIPALLMLIVGCNATDESVITKENLTENLQTPQDLSGGIWLLGVHDVEWSSDYYGLSVLVDENGDRIFKQVNPDQNVPIDLSTANVYSDYHENVYVVAVDDGLGSIRRSYNYFVADVYQTFTQHNSHYNNADFSESWEIRTSIYHKVNGLDLNEVTLNLTVDGSLFMHCEYAGWNASGYCEKEGETFIIENLDLSTVDVNDISINKDWGVVIKNIFIDAIASPKAI